MNETTTARTMMPGRSHHNSRILQKEREMDKRFVEMKLFQVKPDKVEQFETMVEEMMKK